MKKLLIIDGNSIINRAFYGVKPLSTKDGFPTNAVFGFINIVKKQIDSQKPDYIAAAFDLSAPTFRHLQYSEYKAGRKKMPPELAAQLPVVKEFCKAAGIQVLELEGYEADDLIGTYAKEAADRGHEAFILTGDRDSFQLINENTRVLLATNKDTLTFDEEKFKETYQIPAEDFVDMKALMGDASDNIPGVMGIGEKTAAKFIAEFHTIDALYENIDSPIIGNKARENLIAHKDDAFMSRTLARIKTDVPILVPFESTEYQGYNAIELSALFTKLELTSMIKRFDLEGKAPGATECATALLTSKIISADELFALDTSTPAFIDLDFEAETLYLSIDGKETLIVQNFDSKTARRFFESFGCIYAYDSKSIHLALMKMGIDSSDFAFDAMLAGYLLNPADNPDKPERLLCAYLGITPAQDAEKTELCALYMQLCQKLKAELYSSPMLELFSNIELPLARVLAKMEYCGFKVDVSGLEAFSKKLNTSIAALCERIYFTAGREFNLNSPKQLGEVLFDELGLPVLSKTKTGYSTSADVLQRLEPYHPIIRDILDYRQLSKLEGTYAQGLTRAADENGFIHSKFNQAVTNTGRLSSTEPNLQNIPIKSAIGREFRRYFIPKSNDYVLIDADYSQIELRLLAHIAGDQTMINAFRNGIDIHTLTASQVFGVAAEDVSSEQRRRAKAVNFGIVYGIGDFSLAMDIGTTKKVAGEYIESYLEKYAAVSAYLKEVVENAYKDGYVSTIFGRRRYIPELKMGKKLQRAFGERVAMNSPIQGSAADIIKLAMVNISKKLEKSNYDAHLILQVHDELVVESHRSCAHEVSELVRYEMEHALELSVPLTVDMFIADNWYK